MKKWIALTAVLLVLLLFLLLGKAGAFLSTCFLEVSTRYKDYSLAYQQKDISKEEFEESFLNLRQENLACQRDTASSYHLPNFLVELLTIIFTNGRGLP